jgi:hypothetical protein
MLGGKPTCTLFHCPHHLSRDRRMFAVHCENIVRAATRNRVSENPDAEAAEAPTLASRVASLFRASSSQFTLLGSRGNSPSRASNIEDRRGNCRRVHPHMIRRVDDAPKLVDPSGWISEGQAGPINVPSTHPSTAWEPSPSTELKARQLALVQESRSPSPILPAPHESRVGRPENLHR